MPPKPRFTLKAILGCMAALSVPLAMIAAGYELALFVLPITVGVSIGYLVNGLRGAWVGVLFGLLAIFALTGVFFALFFSPD